MTTASPTAAPPTHRRYELPPTAAYWLMAAIIGLALFASATPSPLYATYREEWGFSSFVLTAIFAVYSAGVLAALLVAGRISDDVGRRPVLVGSLVVLLLSTAMFVAANSVLWLFAARALQGVATGVALGSAGAALLDLHPRRDSHSAGLANGFFSTAGMGLGAFIAAVLVQYGPIPMRLPYLVLLVVFGALLVGALLMPEPVAHRRPLNLRFEAPHVPPAIRGAFVLSGLGVLASWSIGGLFMSLGPQLAAIELGTDNHVAGGLAILALTGSGSIAQLVFQRAAPHRLTTGGAVVLAVGLASVVGSLSLNSGALFLAASVLTGVGWGTAFLGALRSLTAVIPAETRARTMSAFYLVAYSSLSIPALAAGLTTSSLGLLPTFRIFGAVVAVLALVVAVAAHRTRPTRAVGADRAAGAPVVPIAD
ncbi:MFS transporter [Patulibacter sp.]|uniref:MFS transporter n=1 Tax=Patulibacter sp. TaxID=1912859 RepID=UPI002727692B|nr:MFS transporter [Patulibacter sp.]MDO9408235.1 MFS transporter [Patulibacter sp.]